MLKIKISHIILGAVYRQTPSNHDSENKVLPLKVTAINNFPLISPVQAAAAQSCTE